MKKARPFLALMSLSSLAMAASPAQGLNVAYDTTPVPPTETPTPPGEDSSVVTIMAPLTT